MKGSRLAGGAVLAALLTGCISSGPQSRFFTLEPVAAAARVTDVGGPPIGIGSVDLPPALDRHAMVVYRSSHSVTLREFERWAAPFDSMVPRVLGFDLASRLPADFIVLPGAPKPDGPMRSLDVVVETFAAGPDNEVTLDAEWTLGAADDNGTPLSRREHVVVPLSSLQADAIATAMSAALGQLADRIAAGLAGGG